MIEQNIMNIKEKLNHAVSVADLSASCIDTSLRTAAQEAFQQLGIPTIKNEEWRFTNILPYLKEDLELDNFTKESNLDLLKINDLLSSHVAEIKSKLQGESKGVYRLVLMNGNIVHELSNLPKDTAAQIAYLSEIENTSITAETQIADFTKNHFVALNTVLVQDGLWIKVLANQNLDKPIHIVHLYDTARPTFVNERTRISLEKNASVEIIETYYQNPNNANKIIVNAVNEIALAQQSFCKHYDIQKTQNHFHLINYTAVNQAQHSEYSNYVFTLPGGNFFRNNLIINIENEATHCHLYGLYLTDKNQLVDNHTEVHHKYPHCESNQLYKGVLQDESKAVFNGKIFVYEDAQKTNAFQQSNNILLSEQATINAKPQLEIFADDVKCSHGTTVGQIDEQAIFYLKSRGIGADTAKRMMVNAFAFDVTAKVANPAIRQYLEAHISASIQ